MDISCVNNLNINNHIETFFKFNKIGLTPKNLHKHLRVPPKRAISLPLNDGMGIRHCPYMKYPRKVNSRQRGMGISNRIHFIA